MLLLFGGGNAPSAATPSITLSFGTTVVTDSFDRDDASTIGTADSGQIWSSVLGTWGIKDNQAASIGGVVPNAVATIDSGIADGVIQVTVSPTDAAYPDQVGLSFRVQNSTNRLLFRINPGTGGVDLSQIVASVGSTLAVGTYTVSASNVLKVIFVGPRVECYVDDILVARTASASALLTETQHGLVARNEPAATRWNDFSVRQAVCAIITLSTAQAAPSIQLSVVGFAHPFGFATPRITLSLAPAASSTRLARSTPRITATLAPVGKGIRFGAATPRITLSMAPVGIQTHQVAAAFHIRLACETHTIGGFTPAGSTVVETRYNAAGSTVTGDQEIAFNQSGVSTLTLSQRE